MSLFQCQHCGGRENTALAPMSGTFARYYDWSYAPERKGLSLCSACGPVSYSDGKPVEDAGWHGQFPQVFLPLGEFHTNRDGNLEHTATGSTDYRQFAIERQSTE